eukprot:222232_1
MASLSRVTEWVKTNRLLDETNDIVFNNSINEIIDALGGVKCILFELTKTLKIEQLKAINKIISIEQRKYNTQNNNQLNTSNISIINDNNMQIDTEINDNDDNDIESMDETQNKSLFIYLPNECLSHICSYLNKQS